MSAPLPPQAYAASLAGLARITVQRLYALLSRRPPEVAYRMVVGDCAPDAHLARLLGDADLRAAWRRSALARPPAEVWQRCVELGLTVTVHGVAPYPQLLGDDPLPPAVLFSRGDLALLSGRRVAIVGTRNASRAGRQQARALAEELAVNGVHVVSGLARGVDGHAHRGALAVASAGSGRPIGVVASGLDVVYPREHRDLWQQVGEVGLLLSEAPPGTPPEAYRFPLRNRIIAAVSEAVVVVESRERGGSLITAAAAAERGVPVMAMPGPASSRAALGVNNLLRDGSTPVIDASDVLCLLSLDHSRHGDPVADLRPRPRSPDQAVYRLCAEQPHTLQGLVLATGRELTEVAMAVARLEHAGWLLGVDGWYETVGRPLR